MRQPRRRCQISRHRKQRPDRLRCGGVERSPQATLMMHLLDATGAMANEQDDLEGLKQSLDRNFSVSEVNAVGCVALFWARK